MAADKADEKPVKGKKHRGIPEAVFLSDVGAYIKEDSSRTSENVLAQLDEQYQKYKFMETNLAHKRSRLEQQIPDIQSTIDAIKFLKQKKANVMLEYDINEANTLLSKNLDTAKTSVHEIADDLDYLRDQITTSEVNMARVYNWDVKQRQSTKGTKS